jgi:ATP/maltotriose-dependent transcriptional regulator MalT
MESLAIYRALGVHDRQHAVIAGRALGLLDSV